MPTAGKSRLYCQDGKVEGFKIDIPIIFDYGDMEIDLCAVNQVKISKLSPKYVMTIQSLL
jgi:hypothetical protein